MRYAILCYDSEAAIRSWTAEEDAAVIAKLEVVQDKLKREGKLGPVARLMPTTSAATLRKGRGTVLMDGPFAETKEQLLGFFIVEVETFEDAVAAAQELAEASGSRGCYELRPISIFKPGTPAST
jgi:hypothetical protein